MSGGSKAVFLSYASEDARDAVRIAERLKSVGIEVWFDQSELRGGDAWDRKIRDEIRACALFVPIISQICKARPEGYFRLEWRLADQRTYLMGKGRVFIVPVGIDETTAAEADVPDSFAATQWMRLTGPESLEDLAGRVGHLLTLGEEGAVGPELQRAEQPFRQAIALNARSSLTCVYYGWYLTLAGRAQEAEEVFGRAAELDPLSPLIRGISAGGLCVLRRFEEAKRAALLALELQADYGQSLWWLGLAYLGQQQYDEALQKLERVVALSRAPLFVGTLGMGYGLAGRSEDARQLLRELDDRHCRGEFVLPCAPLAIQLGLGNVAALRDGFRALASQPAQQCVVRTVLGPFLDATFDAALGFQAQIVC